MKNKKVVKNNQKYSKVARDLVYERIFILPNDYTLSIGADEYDKEELLKGIKEGNEIGNEIIDLQLDYLRDMAAGAFYNE